MVVDTINTTSDVLIPTEAAPKVGEDVTSPLSIQTVEPLKDDDNNNPVSDSGSRDEFRDAGNSTPCDSIQNYAMDLAASKEVSVVEDKDTNTDNVESSESIPPPPPPAVVEVRDEPDATEPVETEVAAPDVTITVTSSNEKLEEEKDKESSGDNNMQCLNTDSVEIVLPDCGCDAGAAFGTTGEEVEKPDSEDAVAKDKEDTDAVPDETEGKPMDNKDVKVDNEATAQPVDEQETVEKNEEEALVIETKDSSTASAEACSEFFVKRISSIQVKAAEMAGTLTATSDKVEDGVENEEEVPVGKSSQVTEVVTKSPEVEAAEITDAADDAMPPSSESEKDASFVESLYEKIEICIGDVTSFCGPTSTKKAVCAAATTGVEKEATTTPLYMALSVETKPEEQPAIEEKTSVKEEPASQDQPAIEEKTSVKEEPASPASKLLKKFSNLFTPTAAPSTDIVEKQASIEEKLEEQTPVSEEEPKADEEPASDATPPADTPLSPTVEEKADAALDKLFTKPPPIENKKTSNKAKALTKLSSMKKVASNSFQRAKKGKLMNKFKSRKGKKALSPSPVNTPSPDKEPSTSKAPIVDEEADPITATTTAENEESKDVVEEKIDDSPSNVKDIDESTTIPVEDPQTVENVVDDSLAEEESPKEEEDSKIEESSD